MKTQPISYLTEKKMKRTMRIKFKRMHIALREGGAGRTRMKIRMTLIGLGEGKTRDWTRMRQTMTMDSAAPRTHLHDISIFSSCLSQIVGYLTSSTVPFLQTGMNIPYGALDVGPASRWTLFFL
jgi:hypothetical protein